MPNKLYTLDHSSSEMRKALQELCREHRITSGWIKNTRKSELTLALNGGLKSARLSSCDCLGETETHNSDCQVAITKLPWFEEKISAVSVDSEEPKSGSLEGMLANAVTKNIKGSIDKTITTAVDTTKQHLVTTFDRKVKDVLDGVEKKVAELRRPINITIGDSPTVNLGSSLTHPLLPDVIECLHHFNKVLLVGKAGTGKSWMIKQASKSLGYDTSGESSDFVYVCGTSGVTEGHLTGRMLFDGTYKDGLAVAPFEKGGVLCADEFDGFDENCALVFNGMLDDQGVLAVPNRPDNPVAHRHEKFKFAGCANTMCDGADFSYSGRNQLDRATLDRFGAVIIKVDYDKPLERALIGEYSDTAQMLWSLRRNIDKERIEKIISTRRFKDAHVWRKLGHDNEWIMNRFTVSWTKEEIAKANCKNILEVL
jgi:hypothetical protein